MGIIRMALASHGYQPETKKAAVIGVVVAVTVVFVTFALADYVVALSILVAVLFPLYLWFNYLFNTIRNCVNKWKKERKEAAELLASNSKQTDASMPTSVSGKIPVLA